jgi:two-component system, OmpR family, sensor kinase
MSSGQPGRAGHWGARARRWLAGRTLRGRLVAGLIAMLAIVFAAIGIVTYVTLSSLMISQVDAQLRVIGPRFAQCLEYNEKIEDSRGENDSEGPSNPPTGALPGEHNCNIGQAPGTFGARIRNGVITSQSVVYSHRHLSASDRLKLLALPPDNRYRTVDLQSLGGDYRLQVSPGMDKDVLITGLPLGGVESTLRKVELAEIVIFAAALAVMGITGTGFVRLALRPLRRVAATATRVTQLPLASGDVSLTERVPDANPCTEVGQVGAAFNRMLGHVEAALGRRAASEARLRRFAADASHELRTPLAAIRGYAELARRHPGPIPLDIGHALSRVESESARMSVLVDELLLLAQLDAGRPLAKESVDLTRLTIDATSDARAASPDHRWQLELPDEPVIVSGDEHRLHQVLANLMSNAAKHTPAGTTVTVSLGMGGAPATVELSVTDDGPGIPEDLQPSLFERFVRGDSSRSRAGGSTGLGLAIVDAVTTAHGGTVAVSSRPGHTRFLITLPRLDTGQAPADDTADQPVRSR